MTDAPHPRVLRSLPDNEREEFIEWLHQSREDDVRRASRSAMKKYVRSATAGFVLLVVGIIVAFGVNRADTTDTRRDSVQEIQQQADRNFKALVNSGNAVAVAGCNRDYENQVQFRRLILRAKTTLRANLARGDITQRQYIEAVKFYDRTLEENALPDCRVAQRTVTADPERNIIAPRPLYPGHNNDRG